MSTMAPERTGEEFDLLFGALAISLPAVSRHLKVLERASIITRSHEGRWRRAQLSPASLAGAAQWLSAHEQLWAVRRAARGTIRMVSSRVRGHAGNRDGVPGAREHDRRTSATS